MGLDIYIVRGDAWPVYEKMVAHHDRLWREWERRGHNYRPFSVFSDAFQRFCGAHVFDCPEEWAVRPGGNSDPGYVACGSMIYGTELHERFLWRIFRFSGCDYTAQDWTSVHRNASRVLALYKAGRAGQDDAPRTSAQLILECVVRVSGWILEEPDPSAYRACYDR